MSALRLLFSADIFLPRGYALGWEPVLLVADAVGQLLLATGGAALALRAVKTARRERSSEEAPSPEAPAASGGAAFRPRVLGAFGVLLFASALVDCIGLWRFWPGLSALLRGAAGCAALWTARSARRR